MDTGDILYVCCPSHFMTGWFLYTPELHRGGVTRYAACCVRLRTFECHEGYSWYFVWL